jgi:hypothetical protein
MKEKKDIYDEKWNEHQRIKINSSNSKHKHKCSNSNVACERVIVC